MFTLNYSSILLSKGCNVLNPILLKYAIDGIICDRSEEVNECPTEQETYMYILAYAIFKFGYDLLNTLREIPYARMAATAEISIAHDVYDHVQRLSLAYHLSRETGKLIRVVSRGS
jgi:ABC-type bacteriocin/lantibiotic exporter with double-glycine peptidase domain